MDAPVSNFIHISSVPIADVSGFIVWQYVNNVDIFIFDRMNNWDAGWYKSIAMDGYAPAPSPDETGEANWAFFPLMPLVMRYLIRFTHGNVNVVTCIANSLFSLLDWWPLRPIYVRPEMIILRLCYSV